MGRSHPGMCLGVRLLLKVSGPLINATKEDIMTQFAFDDLHQLAHAAVEGRKAANLLAKQWSTHDGIVQCVRAAASLLESTFRQNASHSDQIKVARLLQAMDDASHDGQGRSAPTGNPPA